MNWSKGARTNSVGWVVAFVRFVAVRRRTAEQLFAADVCGVRSRMPSVRCMRAVWFIAVSPTAAVQHRSVEAVAAMQRPSWPWV